MNLTLRRAKATHVSGLKERHSVPPSLRPVLSLRHLALGLLLMLLLLGFFPFEARAQPAPTPTPLPPPPKPLVIHLTRKLSEAQEYYLGDKFPEEEIPVEVRGDGQQWWFIQFEKLPQGLSVKVSDNVNGYDKGQQLQQGRWYPVRMKLPLRLSLGRLGTSPMGLRIRTGTLDDTSLGEVRGYTYTEAQVYANDPVHPGRVKEFEPNAYSIDFYYGQIQNIPLSPSPSPAGATPAPPPESPVVTPSRSIAAYWPYVLIAFLLVGAIVWFMRRRQARGSSGLDPSLKQDARTGKMAEAQIVGGGGTGRGDSSWWSGFRSQPHGHGRNETDSPSEPNPRSFSTDSQSHSGQAKTSEIAAKIKATVPFNDKPEPTDSQNMPANIAKEFEDVRDDIKRLWAALDEKQDALNSTKIYELIQERVKGEINSAKQTLRQEIDEHYVREQNNLETQLRKEIGDGKAEVKASIEPTVQSQLRSVKETQDTIFESVTEAIEERKHLVSRVEEAEKEAEFTANVMYNAKLLGFILGSRVEVLRDGNFDALMDELKGNLEKFFSEEVGRNSEGGLADLQTRAAGVSDAFREVVEKMSELKAEGEGEARRLAERVGIVVAELSGLSAQLKDRQLDIKATVHIPVSTHARARSTFCEELGLAIQQHVVKLSDPLVHFESELERLATSEVIGLADLCDLRFPPGTNGELEGRLKKLFERAGLEDIVPKLDGDFETGTQELLGMIDGQPQQSLKVAKVRARGFIYKQDGTPTLLRKAGVKVYR